MINQFRSTTHLLLIFEFTKNDVAGVCKAKYEHHKSFSILGHISSRYRDVLKVQVRTTSLSVANFGNSLTTYHEK